MLSYFLGVLTVTVIMTCVQANRPLVDPQSTIECHKREFTYRATRMDDMGRQCWGQVTAMSCWGRCDTGEIADWRFPYKKSFHVVCVHEQRTLRKIILRHCDPDATLDLRDYEYYEAVTCACQICDSATTSCDGSEATKLT